MYFICDVYDSTEYGKIKNYNELKNLLIDEVIDDLKCNREDNLIVDGCVDILESIAKKTDNFEYIVDNLEGYGWKVIDLLQLQRDLEDLKNYFLSEHQLSSKEPVVAVSFDTVIDTINKGVK